MDFGSARPRDDDPSAFSPPHSEQFDSAVHELHDEDIVAISRDFASPEIVKLGGRITNASDVYSLGCSVVNIYGLSDFLKSPDDEEATILTPAGKLTPRASQLILSDRVPSSIGVLVSRCLQADPENRIEPQKIPELLAA